TPPCREAMGRWRGASSRRDGGALSASRSQRRRRPLHRFAVPLPICDGEETVTFTLHVHDTVADIGREAWDACAAPSGDPFVSFDFLDACEASGSAVPRQGWAGRHLSLRDEAGGVLGVMPLWRKGHSQGEYVFDHSWADAWVRAGGCYSPNLPGAVPVSPVPGPRFLARPGADAATVRQALLQGALTLTERLRLSSLHVNFPTREEWTALADA